MKKQTYRCESDRYKELQKKLIDDDMSFQGFVNWCVGQYLRGKYNPKEEMEMLRKEMIERLAEKQSMLVSSAWVKENDEELYDWMAERMETYASEDDNNTTEKDIEDFKNGEYLVEYYFTDGGVSYAAGRTRQELANQPGWGGDSWEDVEDQQIEIYLQG